MRANAGILIIVGLLFLMGSGVSADPFIISKISTSNEFPVANGVDQVTIRISVLNSTSPFPPVSGANVTLFVDPMMGTLSQTSVVSDPFGMATFTFKVNKTSGTAHINVTAEKGVWSINPSNINQNIDHDVPYYATFTMSPNGTVASAVPVTITFKDYHENLIDDRNPAENPHSITLHVHGPAPDDCWFDGPLKPHDTSRNLDSRGNASFVVNLTSTSGLNNILLDRFGSIPDTIKSIAAQSDALPVSITQTFDPDGIPYPSITAGGPRFTFYYTLYDERGNPTVSQPVDVLVTTTGESMTSSTLWNGQAWFFYGPRDFTGLYNITATARNNKMVNITKTVRFYNSAPSNLELTANPQMMPSRDAKPDISATMYAKVVDQIGNPVAGESVTFTLHSISYTPATVGYKVTPSFSNTSEVLNKTAITDGDGIATVKFYPTNFSIFGEPNYQPSATGTGKVTAIWNSVERDVDLTWKNYPYLSAAMDTSCFQKKAGDTIDLHLKLTGDGWALTSKPIDVMMITDRSGSMLSDNPDRMVAAMDAAILFNTKMNNNQDRVGLVSFGDPSGDGGWAKLAPAWSGGAWDWNHVYGSYYWVYRDNYYDWDESHWNYQTTSDHHQYVLNHYPGSPKNYGTAQYAFVDLPLTGNPITNKATVDAAITGMVPSGGTPMREGLYRGLKEIIDHPRTGAVSAVILLTDGDWNTGGDPEGGAGATSFPEIGTGSAIQWAIDHDIRIYTIRLGSSGNEADLQDWATKTGGFYRHAPTPTDLADIYRDIAEDLRESAGVETSAFMDFQKIVVNNVEDPSGTLFTYVADPVTGTVTEILPKPSVPSAYQGSTWVAKYNLTQHLIPGPGYSKVGPLYDDMTAGWNSDLAHRHLDFEIGEIKVNEVWETNFRMRVNTDGSYSLMGPDSRINFKDVNGVLSSMPLSNLSTCYISTDSSNTGLEQQGLIITDFRRTDGEGYLSSTLPITWTTTYTGVRPLTHDVMFIHDTDPPVRFQQTVTNGGGTRTQYAQLDLTKLPPGGYQIRVYAYADDAEATDTIGPWSYNVQRRPFIILEN
jgi:hypothetical protein